MEYVASRAECLTGVAALIALVVLVSASVSCGGPDLVISGTLVTATPTEIPTATPSS
jgi:hypothetical protein